MTEPTKPKPRKPRGAAIETTDFMAALDNDPAAAMAALADETVQDWNNVNPKAAGLLEAQEMD